jgi:ribosomal protein S6--L-glutamate ligase
VPLGPRPAKRLTRVARAAPELRIGWVERVSLPGLGLTGLVAKVDTGARTSALHVTAVEHPADGPADPGRRALYVVLPPTGRHADKRVVRVVVDEWVEVRDTSGRLERRPVIETTLEMGPLRRKIRLSLTDRADMRYPMLVGRTSLPRGVLVNPAAKFLLPIFPGKRPKI